MISIIAGKYKGRKLHDLKNLHIRPTQAKVRKSVFQILEPFDGMEVLDLYAGVGTLGIEAMSRGANRVVFVEKNRRVLKVLKKNIELFLPDGTSNPYYVEIGWKQINETSIDLPNLETE